MIKALSRTLKPGMLFCLLIVLVLVQSADTKSAEKRKITKVEVIKLAPRRLVSYATYIGHLKPVNRVTLSAEIAGTIAKAPFMVGQRVKNGELLVQFDTRSLELNLKMNQSNYTLALMDYKREKNLYIKKLSTLAKVASLKNRLDVSKVRLDMSKLELEKSRILSPLDGVIKEKFVERGEYIGPGKKVAEIIDISSVLAEVNIPEKDIRFVKPNKKIRVTLDALEGKQFQGYVKTIGLEADLKSRSFEVEVAVQNPDRELLPGMLARLKMLTLSIDRQVVIPRYTIQEEEDGSFVYAVKNNRTEKRPIKLGISVAGEVQVLSGLKFGEYIVETGQQLVTDQEIVKIIEIKKQTS